MALSFLYLMTRRLIGMPLGSLQGEHAKDVEVAVPAGSLKPGLYTCQVNVIDDVAGAFSFPRLALLVREQARSR